MKLTRHRRGPHAARGIALVTSLLLLLIITLLALSMFRSFGIQGRIAGNTREKQRALLAAEAAQQYAEFWLSAGLGSTTSDTVCSTTANNLLNANLGQGQICSNALASVTTVPWSVGGQQVGVQYNPGLALTIEAAGAAVGSYAQIPVFYIADLGTSATDTGSEVYQIDAVGYGGNANTVAVVESTYEVGSGVTCKTCTGSNY
ncbi:MAG: PilX N-terminal domain-containing pilus assembly protein [Steroidobacteraceae bacterium]